MGNKLSSAKKRESDSAVLKYIKDNGILTLEKTVTAVKNGGSITVTVVEDGGSKNGDLNSRLVNVLASERGNGKETFMRVDILWEDAGIADYNDSDLYGSYRSDYYRMSYDAGVLKIHADKGIEITIS